MIWFDDVAESCIYLSTDLCNNLHSYQKVWCQSCIRPSSPNYDTSNLIKELLISLFPLTLNLPDIHIHSQRSNILDIAYLGSSNSESKGLRSRTLTAQVHHHGTHIPLDRLRCCRSLLNKREYRRNCTNFVRHSYCLPRCQDYMH